MSIKQSTTNTRVTLHKSRTFGIDCTETTNDSLRISIRFLNDRFPQPWLAGLGTEFALTNDGNSAI